jgi:uncharacterized integral membrane protein
MRENLQYIKCYHLAKAMYERDDNFETIEQKLKEKGVDSIFTPEIIKQLKEEHYKKKHKRGVAILFLGLIILLISFILTCINFHANESITYVMFGISSLGLIVIFIGLFDLFG